MARPQNIRGEMKIITSASRLEKPARVTPPGHWKICLNCRGGRGLIRVVFPIKGQDKMEANIEAE